MSIYTTSLIQSNLQAAIDLLAGKRKLRSGLFFCAGDPMNSDQRLALAATAIAHEMDVIHFEFTKLAGCYLTGINLIMPRDSRCLIAKNCRLYLPRSSRRALLVPPADVCGHFSVAPGEVIHHDGKPADLEQGAHRAALRLANMAGVRRAVRGDLDITIVDQR